jgi:hypothetical protein
MKMRRTKLKPARKKRRKGAGKGPSFERGLCKLFSLWVSGGKRSDLFWRTAMSGGRATVAHKKGHVVRQSGDMCAVTPEGHVFTDCWFVEMKFYKRIDLGQWLLSNQGKIAGWWKKCKKEARQYGRDPMLVVKQNTWPTIVITKPGALEQWTSPQLTTFSRWCDVSFLTDMLAVSSK